MYTPLKEYRKKKVWYGNIASTDSPYFTDGRIIFVKDRVPQKHLCMLSKPPKMPFYASEELIKTIADSKAYGTLELLGCVINEESLKNGVRAYFKDTLYPDILYTVSANCLKVVIFIFGNDLEYKISNGAFSNLFLQIFKENKRVATLGMEKESRYISK